MHSQISQLNESPVLLMFDHDNEKELSMKTFESIIDMSNNQVDVHLIWESIIGLIICGKTVIIDK